MTPSSLEEQLIKYLTDAHSIEVQALEQMKRAPDIAGDTRLSDHFSRHLVETQDQEQLVRGQLEALGAEPASVKDLAGRATGIGFALFAKFQPDTPGKLVTHAYSYEHMELAAYDLLARVADRAGHAETAQVARQIEAQEREMAQRLSESFDIAVEAALQEHPRDDVEKQLDKYLEDAHAIEAQAIQLLEKSPKLAGTGDLATAFQDHLGETQEHQRLIDGRLEARGASASKLKDAALRLGALNWGTFFQAQPDTPAKLAAFAYAFEHLEIGAYELLRRVAQRAGDVETEAVAERILQEEREAARRLHSLFEQALEASLQDQGVASAGVAR